MPCGEDNPGGEGAISTGVVAAVTFMTGATFAAVLFRPAFRYMLTMWRSPVFEGADYSHGYIIPLVSVYALWQLRRVLATSVGRGSRWGIAAMGAALALHWMGLRSQLLRLSLVAFIAYLFGLVLYVYGRRVARHCVFPLAYLLFCVPLNFLDKVSFRLRMLVTVASTTLLNGLGIAAERTGSGIYSTAGGGFALDVADPCSGIRSLLALTALTAAYAYFTQRSNLKRWILFAASVPIAVLANIGRITTIALVAKFFGQEIAVGFYHDYSGYIVFVFAIGLMVALGQALQRGRPRTQVQEPPEEAPSP